MTPAPHAVAEATLTIPTDPTWLGFGGLHGGLLCAALLAAASEQALGTPVTLTAHLLAPVPPVPITAAAALVHHGRLATVATRVGDAVTSGRRPRRFDSHVQAGAPAGTAARSG